jgi:hypothetical protein
MKKLLLILSAFLISTILYAQDLSIVTVNAWSGMDNEGFFKCGEYESEEVRDFRQEVLSAGLEKQAADVIVLNGINPSGNFIGTAAESLGMVSDAWVSKSGFRIGPLSLPINLKTGDAILVRENLSPVFAGRKILNGGFSNRTFTFFSRNGSQLLCSRINFNGTDIYIFSVEWAESVFSDRMSLELLLDSYLENDIEPEQYSDLIEDAVSGSQLRAAQAEETLSFINSTAGEAPVVLCGSLNALPGSAEMDLLMSAGFIDVFKKAGSGAGYTLDPKINTNIYKMDDELSLGRYRTDYILIRGAELIPIDAELVFNKPVYGVYPSNRFGVKAVIRLSGNPSGQ